MINRNIENNVENNVENKSGSILLGDGHFLFKGKKKSTSPTWSYFDIKNNKEKDLVSTQRGITLIALIITIILMLILAGVVLNLAIGDNGLIKLGKKAGEEYKISAAKEKIELAVMDYEAKMRKETIYSILDKIEGLESIEPDNEKTGLPYTVTVDGYKFLVKEGIEVIYQEKATGIIPEIVSITKNVISETQAKINIEAKTKDAEGIEKLILIKNGVAIEEREVNGKSIKEEFSATGNGQYKIKIIGKNKRRAISKEIQISEMNIGSAQIISGEIIEGQTLLTITGDYGKQNITKIEIYEGQNKIKEITYKEAKQQIQEEYQTEYMPFYQEKTYTAKLIVDQNNQTNTNQLKLKNKDTIKTEEDLKTLAKVVNEGESFETKIIKQIENITLTKAHTAIGTINTPFKGTYNGQEKLIDNIQINNTTLENQGLFGYIEKATIKNITIGTGAIIANYRVGAIVGSSNNSIIDGCINNATTVKATGYIEESSMYSSYNWKHRTSAVAGIVGYAYNSDIKSCTNKANVTGTYRMSGGIVGYYKSMVTDKHIIQCNNYGYIDNNEIFAGGIVGLGNADIDGNTKNNVTIEKCNNYANIGSEKTSEVGGIFGWILAMDIKECKNQDTTKTIQGKYNVGGITGAAEIESNIYKCENEQKISTTAYHSEWSIYNGYEYYYNAPNAGGICGLLQNHSKISYALNYGEVTSAIIEETYGTAGIAGRMYNGCTIEYSGNEGKITSAGGLGGIVGVGLTNSNINSCYNKGKIEQKALDSCGGIIAFAAQVKITNVYNVGEVKGIGEVGGIAGAIRPHNKESYTNNDLYYCYNSGNVTGTGDVGAIVGYYNYYDQDYSYALTGTYSTLWGKVGEYKANRQGFLDNIQASDLGSNEFVEDTNEINNGYPILKWQLQVK